MCCLLILPNGFRKEINFRLDGKGEFKHNDQWIRHKYKRLNKVFPEVAFMLNNMVVYYISKHINATSFCFDVIQLHVNRKLSCKLKKSWKNTCDSVLQIAVFNKRVPSIHYLGVYIYHTNSVCILYTETCRTVIKAVCLL